MRADGQRGALYVVATPIGDLRDITYRAVEVLTRVDVIAAEDTRDVAPLLARYGITTRAVSYHDFNERRRTDQLIVELLAGKRIALVSDAGTPLINDPGYLLVKAAIAKDIDVVSIPGPCAAIAAITVSGLPVDRFLYLGYPPRTRGKRQTFFRAVADEPATIVMYEAPHRLIDSLTDLLDCLGDRHVCLARNLTKPHERLQRGAISQLLSELRNETAVRGEATLVIGGIPEGDQGQGIDEAAQATATRLLNERMPVRSIASELHERYGMPRRAAYALALELQQKEVVLEEAEPS